MRLAGHLKKTLQELDEMSCDEYALWQAWSRHHLPFDSGWEQAAMLACMIVAPYTPRGRTVKPEDFIPVMKSPQAQRQIDETLKAISEDLNKTRQ
jgi:hypothetical protein